MNGIHEVTGSIPVWSTIRLSSGPPPGGPKARSWRATLAVECPERTSVSRSDARVSRRATSLITFVRLAAHPGPRAHTADATRPLVSAIPVWSTIRLSLMAGTRLIRRLSINHRE
jgi:hypothetical protein